MPTINLLKKEFSYGYDSGDILSIFPWRRRGHSRNLCGGSHRGIFFEAIKPWIKADSNVMELGSGAGAWSRAILQYIPKGTLLALDFQATVKWLHPEKYNGRITCVKV